MNPRHDEHLPEHYIPAPTPYSTLPESFEEQGKEVTHNAHEDLPPPDKHGKSVSDQTDPKDVAETRPKILGLPRKYFYIILGVVILIIIGAIVGGVVGSKSNAGSEVAGNNQAERYEVQGLGGNMSPSELKINHRTVVK